MIVVTGTTGKLGRRIVEQLVQRMPAGRIVATTRDPSNFRGGAVAGVQVRQADFAEPDSLAAAFAGADQVLMVSSNAERYGGDAIAQHQAAIQAARDARVRRVLYTSHMGASAASAFLPMHTHAATEAILRESGLAWTALRNGFYAETVPELMVGNAVSTGVLAAPADGKVSWTTHEDLATAAAAILVDEGRFDGPTPPLTSSEALDLADVAKVLSDVHERPVVRKILPDEMFETAMRQRNVPDAVIAITLGIYRAARAGEFAAVDPTLGDLIGRAPLTVRDIVAAQRG